MKNNKDKIEQSWEEKYQNLWKLDGQSYGRIASFITEQIQKARQEERQECDAYWLKKIEEGLLDQLYRFEGIMSKYNCQHGGMKCEFQTNFHRLIREEISEIKKRLLENPYEK